MSAVDIDEVMRLVERAAREAQENAGYSGAMHDGGAGHLTEQVKFYRYGRSGVLPAEWAKYANKTDPEWATYQRLREKFGDRS